MPTRNSWSQSHLESTMQSDTAYESQTAASEGEERDVGRERGGRGCQERGSCASSTRAEVGLFFPWAEDVAGARQAGCAGQGLAAGWSIRTRIGMILGLQGKVTARSPIIAGEAW